MCSKPHTRAAPNSESPPVHRHDGIRRQPHIGDHDLWIIEGAKIIDIGVSKRSGRCASAPMAQDR